jgi:hypothetical protein
MLLEEGVFARHVGKRLLLDSNLFLVLLAGAVDRRLFGSFKRISTYSVADYEFLERLVSRFSILLTTPHILTEVGNLATSLHEQLRQEWNRKVASLLLCQQSNPGVKEHWTPASQLSAMPEFISFGLADAAVADLSSEALVVTDDYRLSGYLQQKRLSVLNFRDLRRIQQALWL